MEPFEFARPKRPSSIDINTRHLLKNLPSHRWCVIEFLGICFFESKDKLGEGNPIVDGVMD